VQEDFSKLKHPSQITINTFYASIEPWIRPIKEEDVGFLEFTADEVEPYVMPKLGRPYSEVWEEEDTALYGGPMPGFTPARVPGGQGATSVPTPKWDPSTLVEPDLVTEEKGHGPLTERLISALLPIPDLTVWKGVKAAEDAMEGRPGGSGAAAARREKVNVSDLEDRIRDTMRFYGLLDRTVVSLAIRSKATDLNSSL
jgi:transcriptional adapter 3